MTCNFELAQTLMASQWFCLPNFTDKDKVNPWYGFQVFYEGTTRCDLFPMSIFDLY